MSTTGDRLVEDYLKRLRAALRDLPRDRRREIADEVAAHIAEARAQLPEESEAAVRTLLDRVGDPSEIAAAELERVGPRRSMLHEVAAIVLLLVGGFVFVVGWLAGVVLLWASDAWTTRDKLVGTLVVPGGLVTALVLLVELGSTTRSLCKTRLGGARTCTLSGHGTSTTVALLVVALLVLPLATTVYLAVRMRVRPAVA
jgi:hypothetical protein